MKQYIVLLSRWTLGELNCIKAKIISEYTWEFIWKETLRWAGRVRKEDGVGRDADPKNKPAPTHGESSGNMFSKSDPFSSSLLTSTPQMFFLGLYKMVPLITNGVFGKSLMQSTIWPPQVTELTTLKKKSALKLMYIERVESLTWVCIKKIC